MLNTQTEFTAARSGSLHCRSQRQFFMLMSGKIRLKGWFMQKSALALMAACMMFMNSCSAEDNTAEEKNFFAMDTAVSVKGNGQCADTAEEIFLRLDGIFDRYSPESDIYSLNQRLDTDISQDTQEIIIRSIELSDKYGDQVSIFAGDITDCWNISADTPKIPSLTEINAALDSFSNSSFSLETMSFADEKGSIDLGAVAKGYALDKISDALPDDSWSVISTGSSVLLHGEKPDGNKFTVSVRDPETGGSLGMITSDACFISTSGGYERYFEADGKRYSHIFDLSTGCPSETDLTSVTVICQSGIESDFLSTLIYLGGTQLLEEYMSSGNFGVIAVTENRDVYVSDGVDFQLAAQNYKLKEASDG